MAFGTYYDLAPGSVETRARWGRVTRIIKAMQTASDGYSLMTWLTLPEDAVVRRYAEAVEPLLREAEERAERAEKEVEVATG